MKYEDLTQMYWIINKTMSWIEPDTLVYTELEDGLNWCLSTIDEELRNIEFYNAQCD